jgi:hypothetical protein
MYECLWGRPIFEEPEVLPWDGSNFMAEHKNSGLLSLSITKISLLRIKNKKNRRD